MKTNRTLSLALTFLAVATAASAKNGIKVYTIPKDIKTAARTAAPSVDVNSAPINWKTPADWKELPGNSIRIGNFQVTGANGKDASVTITSFPGDVGGELANWNRWRNELALPPTEKNEITSETVTVGPIEGKLYAVEAETQKTIVASVPKDGATWFFKIRGDKETVNAAKPTFLEFLKSIDFSAKGESKVTSTEVPANPHANLADGDLPGNPHANVPSFGAKDNPHANVQAADASDDKAEPLPQWNLPANWKEKQAGMMVLKSFTVASDNGNASIAISQFPGDVGGTFANVNRWRAQMGLDPVASNELSKVTQTIDVEGGKATLVDFKGTDAKTGNPARLVAAAVPHAGNTWFYKLLGDDAVVGKEKESFIKFVQTVRYP